MGSTFTSLRKPHRSVPYGLVKSSLLCYTALLPHRTIDSLDGLNIAVNNQGVNSRFTTAPERGPVPPMVYVGQELYLEFYTAPGSGKLLCILSSFKYFPHFVTAGWPVPIYNDTSLERGAGADSATCLQQVVFVTKYQIKNRPATRRYYHMLTLKGSFVFIWLKMLSMTLNTSHAPTNQWLRDQVHKGTTIRCNFSSQLYKRRGRQKLIERTIHILWYESNRWSVIKSPSGRKHHFSFKAF